MGQSAKSAPVSSASALPPEIRAWLADPGFTPGTKHLVKLFAALDQAEREEARKIERALAGAGAKVVALATERLKAADARQRARLIGVIGRVAQTHPAADTQATLLAALDDADPRVRRVASTALAKLPIADLDRRLIERWPSASLPEKRSFAEALGKTKSERALALLRAERSLDPELSRIIERAILMLERDVARSAPSAIALDRSLGVAQVLSIHCRAGLSWVLAEEARALGAVSVMGPDRVRLTHRGTLQALLKLRTALVFGLEIPLPGSARDAIAERAVSALQHPDAERAVRAWTNGRARFRVAFAQGGHQRENVWRIAAGMTERSTWFHNDPQQSIWEVMIDERRSSLELRPLRFADPRFAYRSEDVRAASHPTLAAALARVARVRDDDVVWDPFVGSGLELIERGLLGPYRELHGSDLEPAALVAARANAARAGVPLRLSQADARTHRVPGVTLILSNPPMGRRVARDGQLAALLDAFLTNAAASLLPSGRLVWLSPLPERTAESARRLGLRVTRYDAVDLGGFAAELQRFER